MAVSESPFTTHARRRSTLSRSSRFGAARPGRPRWQRTRFRLGPKVAERILEYREKSGGFKKVEDLMNVRGIGEKSFLKLKPLITVSSGKSGSAEQ